MSANRFNGKVVWITGASSGIGRALALAFDRAGARLILSARAARNLEPVRQACRVGSEVQLLPFDLAEVDTMPQQVEQALRFWGHVDFMVHNAGVALRERMVDTPLRLDQQIMATNYFGPVELQDGDPNTAERDYSSWWLSVKDLNDTDIKSYQALVDIFIKEGVMAGPLNVRDKLLTKVDLGN